MGLNEMIILLLLVSLMIYYWFFSFLLTRETTYFKIEKKNLSLFLQNWDRFFFCFVGKFSPFYMHLNNYYFM